MSKPVEFEGGLKSGTYETGQDIRQNKETESDVKYGIGETAAAMIARDNFIPNNLWKLANESLTVYESMTMDGIDGYDPLSESERNKYEPKYWPIIATARTPIEAARKVFKAQEEEAYTEVINRGSITGAFLGGAFNSILSPATYLPITRAAAGVKMLTSVKEGAKAMAPILAGTVVEEANLLWAQETRTAEESAWNVATASVTGGILAGTGSALRTVKFGIYKDMIESTMEGANVKFLLGEDGTSLKGFDVINDSAGAMSARTILLENEKLLGLGKDGEITPAKPFFWLAAKGLRNPVVRGLMSKSKTVAGFVNDAYEHNFEIVGSAIRGEARPPSLQSLIADYRAKGMVHDIELSDFYYEQIGLDREGNKIGNAVKSLFTRQDGYLTYKEFLKKHAIAIVKGGIDEDFPVIAKAAKNTIEKYLNPAFEELVTASKLSPDIEPFGAMQHLMRLYDKDSITANRSAREAFLVSKFSEVNEKIIKETHFKRQLQADFDKNKESLSLDPKNKELQSMLKKSKEALEKEDLRIKENIENGKYDRSMLTGDKQTGTLKLRPILDENELKMSASNTIDNILSLSEEQMTQEIYGGFRTGSGGNPSQPRNVLIPDVDLFENGFLLADARKSVGAYLTRVGRLVESDKYFKSQGYTGEGSKLEFLTGGIKEDYKNLRTALENKVEQQKLTAKTQSQIDKIEENASKERIKLEKQQRNDIDLVSKTYRRLMGDFPQEQAKMIRLSRFLNNWSYASQLGALTLLGLQDAVAPIYRNGIIPYIKGGVLPFLKGALKGKGDNKVLRESMSDLAIGIDTIQAFYNQKFELGLDHYLPMNFVERQTEKAANVMGIINLSNSWTDIWKTVAGTATQSRLSRNIKDFVDGKLTGNQLAQFKVLRLNDPKWAKIMLEELNKHGKSINGAFVPNIHLWENGEAAKRFRIAVRQELNSTIFSGKNIASYPIELEFHGLANSMLMYMGYGFNATSNYLLPMLQRFDTNKLAGIAAIVGASMLVDPLRMIASGKELSEEDLDPLNLFKKGIFNSGVLGTYSDIFNRVNASFDIFPELQVDRFKGKGKLELLSGAPYSFINFLGTVAGQAVTNEWNKNDLKTMKRNWPLVEVLWARKFGNDLIDSLDIPETRSQARKEKE